MSQIFTNDYIFELLDECHRSHLSFVPVIRRRERSLTTTTRSIIKRSPSCSSFKITTSEPVAVSVAAAPAPEPAPVVSTTSSSVVTCSHAPSTTFVTLNEQTRPVEWGVHAQ